LCVLWCGAGGGKCTEVVKAPAGGAGGGSGGKDVVDTTDPSTSGPDTSDSPIDVPRVNQSTEKSEVKSLEGNGDNVDQQDVVSRVEDEKKKNSSEQLEETVKDAPEKEKTKSPPQNKEQEIRQPPQSQVDVQQQPPPPPQQSQPPSAPQPHTPASEEGEGVGENSRGGAGQSSLGVEDKGNEDPKNPKEDSLNVPGKESENSEQVQTTVQKHSTAGAQNPK
ncbi:mucin-associated surface protein (MASP), putative, partial [Trypanosoma cruzi]